MIIDLSEWLKAEKKAPTSEGATLEKPASPPPPERAKVEMEQRAYNACQHKVMSIDDKQRTVKCGVCNMWLDPVWCLRELFRYYEQRVDQRLLAIKLFEDREREKEERRKKRREQPRAAKAASMEQHLHRAAYNEYQAKILAARAARQRVLAGKLEQELTEDAGVDA